MLMKIRWWNDGEITEEEYYKYLECEEDSNTSNIDEIFD